MYSNKCKEGNVESTFILIFVLSLEIFPEICKDSTTNRLAVLSSIHKSLIFIQNAYCVPLKNNFQSLQNYVLQQIKENWAFLLQKIDNKFYIYMTTLGRSSLQHGHIQAHGSKLNFYLS